jgi:lipoate-protein ligase B
MTPGEIQLIAPSNLLPYKDAHGFQLEMVKRRKAKEVPDTLILLEHPPVITLGRSATADDVIASPETLDRHNIQVHNIERGGQVTYHGPGQLVGYPIVDLHELKIGVQRYVSNLEEVLIRVANQFGINAKRLGGTTGVFCDQGKIGAIGVRVTRGITFHGFALNVNPDLTHYRFIVPCGMAEIPATSIADVCGYAPSMQLIKQSLFTTFLSVFS